MYTVPGYCGVFRTITALTIMINDLHLRSNILRNKLIWFNGLKNHFIMDLLEDSKFEKFAEFIRGYFDNFADTVNNRINILTS